MSGLPLPPLTRRTAIVAGTAGVVAVTPGCGTGDGPSAADTGVGTSTSTRDEAGVRQAHDRETRMREDALRAARRHPGLEAELRRLAAVHGAHLRLLAASLESPRPRTAGSPVAREARAAARELARDERALAEAHARAALEADSGPFARVLAGMAAAAYQQAHVLDGLAVSGPGQG